ncbi:glycoside hydrolase family 3 protein [Vallitalea okinawensis]|uniref:glycoside hydrolase family 3 protein n=1 Tax=Vallitalea okinawensis TaxID=2078660 RepID=UPI000CFD8649|nr:glycoside hydrolase family 3 N-terminal domain-containing protein [Vallitalea okinawensis]
MKKLILVVIIISLLSACQSVSETNLEVLEFEEDTTKHTDSEVSEFEWDETEISGEVEETDEKVFSKEELLKLEVEELINGMSLEEKVGQMFMLAFRQDQLGQPLTLITEEVLHTVLNYYIGGVILFSENIHTPEQTKELIDDLQVTSKLPLFIAVDEEGGQVSRIGNNPAMQVPRLLNSGLIGRLGDPQKAFETGSILGAYLSELGFNLDFAPVADVNTNPNNPVIGERAFGTDPLLVGTMVAEEVKGMQEQGILATLKHFPGHGDTNSDSHMDQVEVDHDLDRLEKVEWLPFEVGIKAGVHMIMVGHIKTPNATKDNLPASLSPTMVTEHLRGNLGFDQVVITDALEMGAISNYYSSSEAAILAVEAGVDILLMPLDFPEAYNGVIEAVKNGRITEERIDESLMRILSLKYSEGIINEQNELN